MTPTCQGTPKTKLGLVRNCFLTGTVYTGGAGLGMPLHNTMGYEGSLTVGGQRVFFVPFLKGEVIVLKRILTLSALLAFVLCGVVVAWFWANLGGAPENSTPPAAAITQLTKDSATDIRPAWSPDNRWVAFESNRDG